MKIRIAVAINPEGQWKASGYSGSDDAFNSECAAKFYENCTVHFVEVDVPVPEKGNVFKGRTAE